MTAVDLPVVIRAARDASYDALAEIMGVRSRRGQSYARWILWRAIRNHRHLSYPEIGRRTGGYDHSSVLYGVRKIEALIAEDAEIAEVAGRIASMFPVNVSRQGNAGGPGAVKLLVCVECGREAKPATSRTVYPHAPQFWNRTIYLCDCGAYVGCHAGTTQPLGRPGGPDTRQARIEAHAAFDALWRRKMVRDGCSKTKARKAGYKWLADRLDIDPKQCHISMMNAAQACRVARVCRNYKGDKK